MNPVHSWDIFDTLIGRRCGTPQRLWEQVGVQWDMPDFPQARARAELTCQKHGADYTLSDIYVQLEADTGMGDERAGWMMDTEVEAEEANAFPIARYASQACLDDIAVSDMYLTAKQIVPLLSAANVHIAPNDIHVSCYGKTSGTVWPDILAKHHIVRHTGDNKHNDVDGPRRHGIATELAETGLNATENACLATVPNIAWWARYQRLRAIRAGVDGELAELQIDCNMPLLLAAAWDICTLVSQQQLRKVCFLSRDGCLLHRLWRKLWPNIEAEYLWASREAFRNATPSYVQYLNDRLGSDTLLVDLAASWHSFASIAGKLNAVPHLYTPFLGKPPVEDPNLPITYLLDQRVCGVNNSYMEMLNYDRCWHVADVRDGAPVFDQAGEYDMALVSRYHRLWDELLSDVPTEPIKDPKAVASIAAQAIHAAGPRLERVFPGHMKFERRRKLPPIRIVALPDPAPPPYAATSPTVVVGAIDRYERTQWINWVRSFSLTDFHGQLHMLTYRCSAGSLKQLRHRGIDVHECERDRHVVVDRFRDLAVLAAALPPRTWMVSLDVGDLVAQRSPDPWLAKLDDGVEIVVGSEAIRIKDQSWVDKNLRDTFPEHYEVTREHLLFNAGSFAARAGTMVEFARQVWEMCQSKPWTKPNDQDAFNILLHRESWVSKTKFAAQRDGWCANVAATVAEPAEKGARFATEPIATIRQGVCYVADGVVPVFLHHYPRIKSWAKQVVERLNASRRVE